MESLTGWVEQAVTLGDVLCRAVGEAVPLAVGEVDADGSCRLRGTWLNAGGPGADPSRATVAEALAAAVSLLGGAPGDHGGARSGGGLAAAAGWPAPWGRLLAAILLVQPEHPSVLHHVGFRHPTRDAFQGELAHKRSQGEEPRESAAPDHLRGYTAVFDAHRRVEFYLEDQFYPEGPHDVARHWDVVTPRPVEFLRRVGDVLGVEPQIFPERPASPWGAIWLARGDGAKLGVMARPEWWEVPPSA